MAGLFSRAAAKKEVAPKVAKKETVWRVGAGIPEGQDEEQVSASIHELIQLAAESKTVEAKMNVHKGIVKDYAESRWVNDYVELGVPPATPTVVVNKDGEKVTLVVQDRSGQYDVKANQKDALISLLGADAATDLLYTEVSFGFNRDVMAIPGVQEVVEKALENAIAKLTDDSKGKAVLRADQAEQFSWLSDGGDFTPAVRFSYRVKHVANFWLLVVWFEHCYFGYWLFGLSIAILASQQVAVAGTLLSSYWQTIVGAAFLTCGALILGWNGKATNCKNHPSE